METFLGIIILLVAVALVVTVVLQEGKNNRLSGAISGGSTDTFLGKSKSATKQKKLATATTILAVVFAVLVIAMHITHLASQDNYEYQYPSDVVDTVDSGDDAGITDPADTNEGENASGENEDNHEGHEH